MSGSTVHPDQMQRMALCATQVTLNGNRARITGYKNDFATVTDLATGLSAEWSWEAAQRIVNNEGKFQS